jgi:hypothetical protein
MTLEKILAVRSPDDLLLETRILGAEPAFAWASNSIRDDIWDRFLQNSPLGHFQQSSIWAGIKSSDGWKCARVVVWQNNTILGGFQILIRSRRMLREGFLNKGPVDPAQTDGLLDWLFSLVEVVVKMHRIDVLVAQSPDCDFRSEARMKKSGRYAPNGIAKVITATFCIPLGSSLPQAETRMRRTIRLETRQATKRGVVIREGNATDIPDFFRMMRVTCRRQNSLPNPATEESLLELWNALHAKGLVRLTIADCEGKPTAGLLAFRFGERVTQWKKGWSEEYPEKHPNTLLAVESIRWAEQSGATLVDFVGGDRSYARSLMARESPTQKQLASRYFFIVGLGAEPRMLPLAYVLIRNPIARALYRLLLPVMRQLGRVEE